MCLDWQPCNCNICYLEKGVGSHINGIALTPKLGDGSKYVVFSPLNSFNFFYVHVKYLKKGVKNPKVKVFMNAATNRTFEKEGQSDGLVMDAKGRLYFSGVTTGVVNKILFC